jgi:two-component system, cell cycle sensor histidine kinase and response regulator CckA
MDTQERELERLRKELDAAKARIEGLEAELTGKREMFRAAFDATTDMFAMKGPESAYRLVNPAFCRFLGKSEAEILGRTDYDLFPPDDAAMYVKGDAEVMQTLRTEVDDWEVMGEKGKVWLQVIKTPVLDGDGKVSGVFCSIRDISGRKKSELELERFFNLMPDLACIASPEGYFLKVNAAWENLLGYTNGEMLSISFYELIHPEDREATKQQVERQCLGSGVRHFVNRYLARDGSYHSLEWNATPSDGTTLYAVARDITERIENEKETRLWADAFRFCAHGIAIGLPLTNSILTCNEAFARMRGQSVAEIEGSPIVKMYLPEERAKVIENIQLADRIGSVSYESTMMRKDGTVFPVQMDVVSIADEEGHLLYRIATMQDITERQSSQLALHESEARFRSAVESAPDGIFIQTNGRFTYLNPKALEMLGAASPEKVIGREVLEFFHSDFKKIVAERIRTLNSKQQAVPVIEEKMLRIDGTAFDVEVSAVPFMYSGLHGALVFMRDITWRKRAEQERNALERQLFQSQKIESIGRLAGGIAHDLNNLLTPILGYSELMALRFSVDDSRRQHLNVMHDAALRARDLIRQLLAFSSSQSLEFKALDLNAVLHGFEPLLRRTLRANIVMEFRLHDGVLPMQGDAGQLEQIIMNLAINADDSMPTGGLLKMETSEEIFDDVAKKPAEGMPAGRYAVFSVRDTGTGMDSDTLAHVFEPFFTTKQKGKGTGLGLSTVYGIVRQHGGFIDVSSQPGEGTSFRIFFPLYSGGLKAELLKRAANPQEKGHGIILVVEDDDMVRHFIVQSLMQEGFMVYEASGGEDALEMLAGKTCEPDLLLTDLIMRGMNGKELYDKVKPLIPGIRVIYMSGYTKNIITSHGVLDKGITFLQKPFTVQGLLEKVRGILNARV